MRLRAYLRFALIESLWSLCAVVCIWLATMGESYVALRICGTLILWAALTVHALLCLDNDLVNAEEKEIMLAMSKNTDAA